MVYVSISEDEKNVILDCHKSRPDGDYFQLVIDKATRELVNHPAPDIDKSAAYSCVWNLLREGKPLPKETVAEWG